MIPHGWSYLQLSQLQLQESEQGQGLHREGSSSSNSICSGTVDDTCPRHGMYAGDPSARCTPSQRRISGQPCSGCALHALMHLVMSHTHIHTHPHTHPHTSTHIHTCDEAQSARCLIARNQACGDNPCGHSFQGVLLLYTHTHKHTWA